MWTPHPFLSSHCLLEMNFRKLLKLSKLRFSHLKMEIVTDFIFGGSKITADGDCSHEIKRHLLLGRKVMTNLNSELETETLHGNKGPSSQSYGFSSSHV